MLQPPALQAPPLIGARIDARLEINPLRAQEASDVTPKMSCMSETLQADTPPATDPSVTETMTVAEAAAYLNKPERTVRRYAATGKLSAEQVAGEHGRPEWRIYARAVHQLPDAANAARRPTGRKSEDTVPLTMYRDAREKLDAALVQVGQLTEVRSRLLLAEKTEGTLREELAQAQTRVAELEAMQRRRRWFGISRKERPCA